LPPEAEASGGRGSDTSVADGGACGGAGADAADEDDAAA